jgi:hypothetical protein
MKMDLPLPSLQSPVWDVSFSLDFQKQGFQTLLNKTQKVKKSQSQRALKICVGRTSF